MLENENQISVFHYGGHAGRDKLLFTDQAARADGIAYLLSQQQHLKLVFLNGCSTRQHVDLLLELGISAVIATSQSVGDTLAKAFAEHFYKAIAEDYTLENAFNAAVALIKTMSTFYPRIYRDAELRGDKTNQLWGLYTNNKNDILNQKLISGKMEKEPTTSNSNHTEGNGNIIIQGANANRDLNITINQTNKSKDLKTQAIEKILQAFSSEATSTFKSWISPHLFKGDATIQGIVTDNSDSDTNFKKKMLGYKLDNLLKDVAFKNVLQQKLGEPNNTIRQKNVLENTDLDVKGNAHFGDKGSNPSDEFYSQKNIIKGSIIKVRKDFHLGDVNTTNNTDENEADKT